MSRRLSVAVQKADDPSSPLLLQTLVRTLGALQKLALQVGEMLADTGSRRSRGEFSSEVRRSCELVVQDLRTGSLEADLALRPAEPCLFPEFADLGLRTLDAIHGLTQQLTNGSSWADVRGLLPDEAHRRLILKTYKLLCPTASEGVLVSIGDPEGDRSPFRLSAETRSRVQVLAAQRSPEDVLEERQLIGRLVMLRSRPPCFEIKQPHRSFTCPYDPDLEETLLDLYDATVRVRGVFRVVRHDDRDDEVLELLDIGEIAYLDETELTVAEIATENGTLPFAQPLTVSPDFSDNLVTFEYPPVGVMAYADTREEAEKAFCAELAWLWLEYANAPDETLTEDARRLKRHMRALVGGSAA